MSTTRRTVRSLAILLLAGGLWVGLACALDAAPLIGEGLPGESPGELQVDFWLRADYLMWWTNGTRLPALVTTSPPGTAVGQAGVLPAATILEGDQRVNNDFRSGFRATLGMWLDASQNWNVQFDYLSLGEASHNFSALSQGIPILARPIFNVQTNQQGSELVAYTGVATGSIAVNAKEYFQTGGVALSSTLSSNYDSAGSSAAEVCAVPLLFGHRAEWLAGFRYYNLSDSVTINEDTILTQAGPTQNSELMIRDRFRANNDFYGAELGLRAQFYRARWSLELLGKLAFGNTRQTVNIDGRTVVSAPNQPTTTADAGIVALGTNSGVHQSDSFTAIPQLGIELGYQVSCNWRAYIGYNVLYWQNVSRSADQIDLNIDPRNIPPTQPGATHFPEFPGRTSCFWAQGINFGAERRF